MGPVQMGHLIRSNMLQKVFVSYAGQIWLRLWKRLNVHKFVMKNNLFQPVDEYVNLLIIPLRRILVTIFK